MTLLNKIILLILGGGVVVALGATPDSRIEFTETQYTKDTEKSQVFDIPDDAIRAKVAITRGTAVWPEKGEGVNVIEVITEVWSDEINWGNHCGFTTDGGDRYVPNELTKELELSTESYNECALYEGRNRKIRVTVRAKETLETKASVEFYAR